MACRIVIGVVVNRELHFTILSEAGAGTMPVYCRAYSPYVQSAEYLQPSPQNLDLFSCKQQNI
jgi:hypothetical protein